MGKLGDYPAEYNPKIHGTYNPAVYYGKKDIPLAEVKLSELVPWFTRRSLSPVDWVRACSRLYWRWHHRFWLPEKATFAPILQVCVGSMIFFYYLNYPKYKQHRRFKYHW